MTYVAQMTEFLKTATDDEWMYVASSVNYEEALPLVEWMITQKRCPKVAALAIYWLMNPGYVKFVLSDMSSIEEWILETIEENYANDYKESELGFSPTYDVFDDDSGFDWTSLDNVSLIPPVMLEPIPGRKLTQKDPQFADWLECRPPHLL